MAEPNENKEWASSGNEEDGATTSIANLQGETVNPPNTLEDIYSILEALDGHALLSHVRQVLAGQHSEELASGSLPDEFHEDHFVTEDEYDEDDGGEEDEGHEEEDFEYEPEEEEYESDDSMPNAVPAAYRESVEAFPCLSGYVPPEMDNDLCHITNSGFMPRKKSCDRLNVAEMLKSREIGTDGTATQITRSMCAENCIPDKATTLIDKMESRGYIGQFTPDGNLFISAFQNDRMIKIYDVHDNFSMVKSIHARNLRWTITDTSMSPDGRFLLYSSITPIVHLVNVGRETYGFNSVANITDIHHALPFTDDSLSEGLWSIRWSGDGKEILAGSSEACVYIFDVESERVTSKLRSHIDDINAVAYADERNELFFSGSDDSFVHVWDRRALGRKGKPVGAFIGHVDGIVHIDSRGDGRYLISNSKDQTIKCWDIRQMSTMSSVSSEKKSRDVPRFRWDYRWMQYPATGRLVVHPRDGSVSTYRGHSVMNTLCRAYWSPQFTTGQRYIYAGCASGKISVYDLISCKRIRVLSQHADAVRDCSWHPFLPLLVSVGFDGHVLGWQP